MFGLLDLFGNVGGVNEILELTGALIVGLFSGKVFLFSVISSLYQVDSVNIGKLVFFLIKNYNSQMTVLKL